MHKYLSPLLRLIAFCTRSSLPCFFHLTVCSRGQAQQDVEAALIPFNGCIEVHRVDVPSVIYWSPFGEHWINSSLLRMQIMLQCIYLLIFLPAPLWDSFLGESLDQRIDAYVILQILSRPSTGL